MITQIYCARTHVVWPGCHSCCVCTHSSQHVLTVSICCLARVPQCVCVHMHTPHCVCACVMCGRGCCVHLHAHDATHCLHYARVRPHRRHPQVWLLYFTVTCMLCPRFLYLWVCGVRTTRVTEHALVLSRALDLQPRCSVVQFWDHFLAAKRKIADTWATAVWCSRALVPTLWRLAFKTRTAKPW